MGWRRSTWGEEPQESIAAELQAGGHVFPDHVLAWLQGADMNGWYGQDIEGDPEVLAAIGRRIHGR